MSRRTFDEIDHISIGTTFGSRKNDSGLQIANQKLMQGNLTLAKRKTNG